MKEKYYRPDITEFFVGFEYESYELYFRPGDEWDQGTPMWIKRTVLDLNQEQFSGENHKYKAIYHVSINNRYEKHVDWNKNIRVKYLDKEDIESLGFKFIKQHPGMEQMDFEKDEYFLDYDPDFKGKHFLRIYTGNSQDEEFNFFSGFIRNKSELKRLLIQLNII